MDGSRNVENLIDIPDIVTIDTLANPFWCKAYAPHALQAGLHKAAIDIEGGLKENDKHLETRVTLHTRPLS